MTLPSAAIISVELGCILMALNCGVTSIWIGSTTVTLYLYAHCGSFVANECIWADIRVLHYIAYLTF